MKLLNSLTVQPTFGRQDTFLYGQLPRLKISNNFDTDKVATIVKKFYQLNYGLQMTGYLRYE